MRDLDLTTLRLFVAVCETGNMARAGEQANIVGSAISKRLAQLENQLGTPLLIRKRHGVVPTVAGQTVLEHARAMLDGAARIERDMASHNAGAHGQVRVFASVSTMTEFMANDVAAFLKMPSHRTIQVDLEERLSPDVVAGVRDGMASIGVCWDAVDLGVLQSLPYCSDHLCVVVPESHPLAGRRSVHFGETLDYEHVSLPINSALQLMYQRAATRVGRTLVHRIVVSNFEVALHVIAADLAIGLIPKEVAARSTASRGLCMVPLDEPWAERRFVMCMRDERALSPAAQKLVEHLAKTGLRRSVPA